MKAFRFTLQALLTLSEEKEQAVQRRYAQALRDLQTALDHRKAVEQETALWQEHLRRARRTGAVAAQLAQMLGFGCVLEERAREADQEVLLARQKVDQMTQELVNARREREKFDKCRERQRHAYIAGLWKAEQKLLDELATRGRVGLEAMVESSSLPSL